MLPVGGNDFLPDAGGHTAAGDVHRADRDGKHVGYVLSRLMLDYRSPKCLPGRFAKLGPDALGRPLEHTPLILAVPVGIGSALVGLLLQNTYHVSIAAAAGLPAAAGGQSAGSSEGTAVVATPRRPAVIGSRASTCAWPKSEAPTSRRNTSLPSTPVAPAMSRRGRSADGLRRDAACST